MISLVLSCLYELIKSVVYKYKSFQFRKYSSSICSDSVILLYVPIRNSSYSFTRGLLEIHNSLCFTLLNVSILNRLVVGYWAGWHILFTVGDNIFSKRLAVASIR